MKSCQKLEEVQTGLEQTGEKLSEVRASSDRFGRNHLKTVLNKSMTGS